MHKFDYTFLKNISLPIDIMDMVGDIRGYSAGELHNRMLYPDVFDSLVEIAKFESVRASNAIEGIYTTDERIKLLIHGNTKPINHDETEIEGYSHVLDNIHSNFATLSLNETQILEFHAAMTNGSKTYPQGAYKTENNVIARVYSDGMRDIIWEPTPAEDTPEAMKQLLLAYYDARDQLNINPLILIPCFILDFLCIHPFSDGNGRMSRLLSLFLLYKSDFDCPKYVSFEQQINKTKNKYYNALQSSSNGWHDNENDYIPFISYFLKTLCTCYQNLDERFQIIGPVKISKKEIVERFVLASLKPVSKIDIKEQFPNISSRTLDNVFTELVKEGKVNKVDSGSKTKYIRNSDY